MISGKTVLGLIPARGGSKGVPKKNIRDAAGKPLIAWTIECAFASSVLDRIILSSDDKEIIEVSRRLGCEVPFVRPGELATDDADSMSVVRHALETLEEKFDYLVLLQPTSPLRTPRDIDEAIQLCVKEEALACVSVCEADKSPYWMMTKNEKVRMNFLFPPESIPKRRQDGEKVYALNGAVYVAKCDHILAGGDFFSSDTVVWEMPKINSIDIDTELDLLNFKLLIKEGKHEKIPS